MVATFDLNYYYEGCRIMLKSISNKQFYKVMKRLYQKDVWVQVVIPATNLHLFFHSFEFDVLTTGKYQFGTDDIDSERIPFEIRIEDIVSIQRDKFAPTVNSEQIILDLDDGTEIIVEYNC